MEVLNQLTGCGNAAETSRPPSRATSKTLSRVHRWMCGGAATSVEVWEKYLFTGTSSGEICVYGLDTYQELTRFHAHKGSVLALAVHNGLLFSGSADSLVKVWDLQRDPLSSRQQLIHPLLKYTIYSLSDIGDILCLSYIPEFQLLYFGAQNASIQWVNLAVASKTNTKTGTGSLGRKSQDLPAVRPSRFFDSAGPGGRLAPPQHETIKMLSEYSLHEDSTFIQVDSNNCVDFAHNGYIYAMLSTTMTSGHFRGRILISGSGDGTLKIWAISPSDGHIRKLFTTDCGSPVLSMTLEASWHLYCGLDNGDAIGVDTETWQVLRYTVSPGNPLLTISAVNDGFIATSGADVILYRPSLATTATWRASGVVAAARSFEFRTMHIATASEDGSTTLWVVPDAAKDNHQDDGPHDIWSPSAKSLDNDAMIKALAWLVGFETVSERPSKNWSENRRCAKAFRDIFRTFGAYSDLLKVENGNPIIYAQFKANLQKHQDDSCSRGRILFYGHYDVIEASDQWRTPPFELTCDDGFMYGRGVSDNKGPCVAAIFATAELYAKRQLANDVVFLLEGEEESGSRGFEKTIKSHLDKIGPIDWIIFSNSYWINDTQPCINYGLRGIIYFDAQIRNDKSDAHSGVDGGLYREPAFDMINLLAQITKNTGEVSIPGFLDNVAPVTSQEESLYESIAQADSISVSKSELMRKWRYPSLTVHKIDVSGPRNQTVIPSSVTANVSVRLVPNQTTAEIKAKLDRYLHECFAKLESPNQLHLSFRYDADPWIGDPGNEAFQLLKTAVTAEWGMEPLFVREGGTIPMARVLEKLFGAPAAQIPCGQSSDNAHLDNERLRITNLIGVRNIFARLFSDLHTAPQLD